ncbi:MAG: 50S ribosomal protein L9 [Dehalococcoidales bacterium]
MKVIFIEDVPNVARAGQNKVVADGYARNYLFPQRLAVLADSRAAAAVESHIKKVAKQRAIEEAEMAELAKVITGTEITLKAKVGEKEHLYGSVTGADIAAELGKVIGREVDKRKVDLAEPIRQVGVYDVTIRFTHDITAIVSVTVMSDEEGAARPVKVEKQPEKVEEKETKAEKKEKPRAVKKEKKEKAPKEAKEEQPALEAGKEPPAVTAAAEKPEEKEARAEKKEKKAKKEEKKVEKEGEPPKEEKKEKKPKAEKKAKKSETKAEGEPKE